MTTSTPLERRSADAAAAAGGLRQRRGHAPDYGATPLAGESHPPARSGGAPSSSSSDRGPQVDLTEVVRERYHRFLCLQQLASNIPSTAFCVSALRSGERLSAFERSAVALITVLIALHTLSSLSMLLRARLPRWASPRDAATGMGRAVMLDWVANLLVHPVLFLAFTAQPEHRSANCPAARGYGECGLVFVRTFGLLRSFRTVAGQVPPRFVWAYEVARGVLTAACVAAAFAADGALTLRAAMTAVAAGVGSTAFVLAVVTLHHESVFHDSFLPPWLDLWPAAGRPARDALLARLARAAAAVRPAGALDYRAVGGLHILGVTLAAAVAPPGTDPFGRMALSGRVVLHVYFTLTAGALASGALAGGDALSLPSVARRMGLAADEPLVAEVRHGVANAYSEQEALRGAAAAVRRLLFPHASALVLRVAAAAQDAPPMVHLLREDGTEAEVDGGDSHSEGDTSLAFVAAQDMCMIADSRDFSGGLATFSDWARAGAAGAEVVITAPLTAGPAKIGTLVARFGGAARGRQLPTHYEAVLMRCCRAIGEGLFVRREIATSHAASALASDVFPAHVVSKLLERNRRASGGGPGGRPSLSGGRPSLSGGRPSLSGGRPSFSGGRPSFAGPRPSTSGIPLGRPSVSVSIAVPASPAESAPASPLLEPVRRRSIDDPAADALRRRISMHRQSQPSSVSGSEDEDEFFSEDHDSVSIVFLDCVQFTPLAESLAPAATMRQLHALFSRFDALCEELGIYKVETVGDEYMAAAGLLSHPQRRLHASAALLFALRAHAAAAACGLRIRAGVHSGPVTSGLIGRLRARFCLFGDTVNVASRLEGAGAPGCVHASRAAWALAGLPEALPEAQRVQLKGKAEPLDVCLIEAASQQGEDAARLLQAKLRAELETNDDYSGTPPAMSTPPLSPMPPSPRSPGPRD